MDENVAVVDEQPSSTRPHLADPPTEQMPEIIDEILVEEVSIDGMCGVY